MDEGEKREEEPIKTDEPKEEISSENKFSNKQNLTDKLRKNPFILSTAICGVLAVVLLVVLAAGGGMTGHVVAKNDIGQTLLEFYESNGADGLTLLSVEEVSGVYKVLFEYEGSTIPIYVTKDGKFAGSLSEVTSSGSSSSTEVSKSDKPVVELFVMSYCPYGTQAEKGMLPVVELLGDKIDFRMRYVSYLMHGEKEAEENLREYCIQEIAPEKYLDYMYCFLEGDGNYDYDADGDGVGDYMTHGNDVNTCLIEAGINTEELEDCISEADEEFSITENLNSEGNYPRFNVDADLNEKYGIRGSPTLVINEVVVSSSRDPASYLEVICSAFTNAPDICDTVGLSSETPSIYFGWDVTGRSTTAQC